jgi:superfamily II DNA/RNA helicase
VGGTSITDNYHQYSTTGGNIITGTPGRILDFKNRYNDIEQKHHQQQNNIFRKLEVLILDEADTLLDMGFKETINQILEYLPKQRRTGLFSATQNKEVRELIRAGLRNPCLISVKVDNNNNNNKRNNNNNNMKINNDTNLNNNDKKNTTTDTPNTNSDDKIIKSSSSSSSSSQSIPTTLDNYYIISEHENRVEILLSLFLQHRHEKIIVFCATCACVEYYSYFFEKLFKDKLLFKSYRSDNNDDSNNNSNGDSDNNNYNNDENKSCFTSNPDYKNSDSSSNTNCNSGNSSNKNDDNNNNNNNTNNNNTSNCNYQIISFHGKMIPKKRNALYKKFVKMTTGGVMFSTDVAARGIDIPDVDWIIQLSSPKDPAFFIHRIGRTARAGKYGSAVLFITLEEISYIELLKGRGVPLKEMNGNNIKEMLRLYRYNDNGSSNNYNDDNNYSIKDEINNLNQDDNHEIKQNNIIKKNKVEIATTTVKVIDVMKEYAMIDRTLLEYGSTAFMSYLRAYKEHLCSYIFRFDQLDIGMVC